MNRDEQEMALWRETYAASRLIALDGREAEADAAVAAFRKRYPPQPAASPAVWYDEPPFPKDGESYPCWISGEDDACAVHWSGYAMSPKWVYYTTGNHRLLPLHNRRVSPVAKPQEPTT